MKRSFLLAALAAASLVGCDETAPVSSTLALEPGCTAIGSPLIDHACIHVTDGSAQSVTASSTLSFSGSTPNVNTTHTFWTVSIPGSGSTRAGAVKYTPLSGGDWAILQNGSEPFTVVRHSTGATIAPVLLQSIATCTGITRLQVYPLSAGITYRLVFGPTSTASTQLVFERVSDFVGYYYPDLDGDSYGDVDGEVGTACLPPTGYIPDSSDCDDTNASIHPGVSDPPGGPDLDCNGIP